MKRILSILPLLAAVLLCSADLTPQQLYIRKWAPTAVSEMYRSGVPASITLAQGLLESGNGLSRLATEGNNHFGIKCHTDWKGRTMKADDDKKGECFRVYKSAEESFSDHSDFLRYRDRYKFLFNYDVTDYKAWANGLKSAGYATDPSYASKLIKLVEDYGLSAYDTMTIEQAESGRSHTGDSVTTESKSAQRAGKKAEKRAAREKVKKARKTGRIVPEAIPESPLSLEESVPVYNSSLEVFNFNLSRQLYSRNGVPFIYAVEGETYESIATSNHLFLKEILKFNDLSSPEALHPGTIVYLAAKKSQTQKGLDKYVVEEDCEVIRDICQRFGVKMNSVLKYNSLTEDAILREGDTIILRKQ